MKIIEKTWDSGEILFNVAEGPAMGEPLVLLHGNTTRWQSFENILPVLAERWHVLAPDLRGHGHSGRGEHYRLLDFAGDTAAFLQKAVGQPAFLFGHSLGGMVALMTAARYPDGVRAVVVADAPLTRESWRPSMEGMRGQLTDWASMAGGQVPLHRLIERLQQAPAGGPDGSGKQQTMADVFGQDHPMFEAMALNLYHNDPVVLLSMLEEFDEVCRDYHMPTLFPAIRCPVLLLQADPAAGGLMSDVDVARAKQLLGQSRHVKLEGISHMMHNENPQAVVKAVIDFLEQVENT